MGQGGLPLTLGRRSLGGGRQQHPGGSHTQVCFQSFPWLFLFMGSDADFPLRVDI